MRDLIKKITDFLDRDIREMMFKRETPQAPAPLPQATEPTETIAAAPKAEDKPAKKPRKKRQTRKN